MKSRIKYWMAAAALGILPLMALAFLVRPMAAAGLWYVAPGGSDAGDCQTNITPCGTIDAAIGKAAAGDTILLAVGTYTGIGSSEVVSITKSVDLSGGWNGAFTLQNGMSTIDGGGIRRGIKVSGEVTSTLEYLVVQNGYVDVAGGYYNGGGGIRNLGHLTLNFSRVSGNWSQDLIAGGAGIYNEGTLIVNASVISANTSHGGDGGGIENAGTMLLNNTTVHGNASHLGGGGGIYNNFSMTLNNSTVSGNTSLNGGGAGIYNHSYMVLNNVTITRNRNLSGNGGGVTNDGGTAILQNSILAGNFTFDPYGIDCTGSGAFTSMGHNLIGTVSACGFPTATGDIVGVDARLDELAQNGGLAPTHALLPGSPAVNAGDPGGCPGSSGLLASDQRGFARVGVCDIGAFEVQPLDYSDKTVNKLKAVPGEKVLYTVKVDNHGGAEIAGVTATDVLPAGLSYVNGSLTATSGNAVYQSGTVSWTGTVSAGDSVTIQYYAASGANASLVTIITNTIVISGDDQVFSRQAAITLANAQLYLPLIAKPLPGIQGFVTLNGLPAAGIPLELRRYDGQTFSSQLMTNTDANGFYNFDTAPSLGAGETYYVRYLNTAGTPGQLWFWGTVDITSFTAGGSVAAGNFDVADVALLDPLPGAEVSLPTLFHWTRRPATPSDSYQLTLFDPSGDAFGQTNLLGYVDAVTLTGLSSEFGTNTWYGWTININSPDGGYGTAYYYRAVLFTNALASSQQSVEGARILEVAIPHPDTARP